jgi:hypothetical protein
MAWIAAPPSNAGLLLELLSGSVGAVTGSASVCVKVAGCNRVAKWLFPDSALASKISTSHTQISGPKGLGYPTAVYCSLGQGLGYQQLIIVFKGLCCVIHS